MSVASSSSSSRFTLDAWIASHLNNSLRVDHLFQCLHSILNQTMKLSTLCIRYNISNSLSQSSIPHQCAICGVKADHRCIRCASVYYCSSDHQKQHWKNHKISCCAKTKDAITTKIQSLIPLFEKKGMNFIVLESTSRCSQFEHYQRIFQHYQQINRIENHWILFSDDDDLWAKGRVDAYYGFLSRWKEDELKTIHAVQLPANVLIHPPLQCANADQVTTAIQQKNIFVSRPSFKSKIDSEYWNYCVRGRVMADFFRLTPSFVLRHRVGDLCFLRFILQYGLVADPDHSWDIVGCHADKISDLKLESDWAYAHRIIPGGSCDSAASFNIKDALMPANEFTTKMSALIHRLSLSDQSKWKEHLSNEILLEKLLNDSEVTVINNWYQINVLLEGFFDETLLPFLNNSLSDQESKEIRLLAVKVYAEYVKSHKK